MRPGALRDFWDQMLHRAGWPDVDRSPGARGERVAARHLKRGGYRIRAMNARTRRGELDLVALAPDGRTIVFVEVKTAERTSAGSREADYAPERRVGTKKQRQIAGLAADYLRRQRLTDHPARFDVIGVTLGDDGETADVRHSVGAFESPW